MNPAMLAAAEEFQKQLGTVVDLTQPISMAEASALRDRFKSTMQMLTALQEHLAKHDSNVASLESRAADADETGKQLRSVASKVNDLALAQKDLIARLKVIEEKLGIVSFNEEAAPAIIEEKKTKAKKK